MLGVLCVLVLRGEGLDQIAVLKRLELAAASGEEPLARGWRHRAAWISMLFERATWSRCQSRHSKQPDASNHRRAKRALAAVGVGPTAFRGVGPRNKPSHADRTVNLPGCPARRPSDSAILFYSARAWS